MTLALSLDIMPLSADTDGVVRVGNTRVTLDTLVAAFTEGATAEEIALQYPALRLADIYQVIAYYLYHQAEVDQYLRQRQAQADVVRQQSESRHDPTGVRDRLLARTQR